MLNDQPIAFLITWTVYGTFLQGDERGWRKRKNGAQLPQPNLARWRRTRLKHPIELLNAEQQSVVDSEIVFLSHYRGWRVWAKNARSNHVHAVMAATEVDGRNVCDQLKANCTRVLREQWPVFKDRPVWTTGCDWRCINDEDDLELAILYVSEAQDRKHRDPSAAGR